MIRVLGIIPCRGGSKGIPQKNIQMLGDMPLVCHTMREASKSKLDRIIVSTEDKDVINAYLNCKLNKIGERVEMPFIRPAELAQDDTPMVDVIVHAVKNLSSEGYNPDAVMILQPTSPFRTAAHINEAIQIFENKEMDCLIGVKIVPIEWNPEHVFFEDAEGLLSVSTGRAVKDRLTSRQDFPVAYTPNGAIYLFKTLHCHSVDKPSIYGDRVFPYLMEEKYGLNIDTPENLEQARKLWK